jgi:hypothetical protein
MALSKKAIRGGLADVPLDEVYRGLLERKQQALGAYFVAYTLSVPERVKKQAILDLGLVTLAEYGLRKPEREIHPFAEPGWLSLARLSVEEYMEAHPITRGILEESFYMERAASEPQAIDRIVSAAVSPADIYSDYELAAGVATGFVTAKVYTPKPRLVLLG